MNCRDWQQAVLSPTALPSFSFDENIFISYIQISSTRPSLHHANPHYCLSIWRYLDLATDCGRCDFCGHLLAQTVVWRQEMYLGKGMGREDDFGGCMLSLPGKKFTVTPLVDSTDHCYRLLRRPLSSHS